FDAPVVAASTDIEFKLIVRDVRGSERESTVVITINPVVEDNTPPVANAGDDQRVIEGDTVVLDGTHSYDDDGDALEFAWMQVNDAAPRVVLAPTDDPGKVSFV